VQEESLIVEGGKVLTSDKVGSGWEMGGGGGKGGKVALVGVGKGEGGDRGVKTRHVIHLGGVKWVYMFLLCGIVGKKGQGKGETLHSGKTHGKFLWGLRGRRGTQIKMSRGN